MDERWRKALFWSVGASLGALLSAYAVLKGLGPGRLALYIVAQSCPLMQKISGSPWPCAAVELRKNGLRTVLIKVPIRRSHFLIVPTAQIRGLESVLLLGHGSQELWAKALKSRKWVTQSVGRIVEDRDVAIAINSQQARTQDQLHLHVDCANASALRRLRSDDDLIDDRWRVLPYTMKGWKTWARRVGARELTELNLFALVRGIPDVSPTLLDVSLALVSSNGSGADESFYFLVTEGRRADAERFLDHSCAVARTALRSTADAGGRTRVQPAR